MSPHEEKLTEETHNFQPVNDHIDQLLNRQRDLLAYRKFRRVKAVIVGIAILVVAMGLFYLLYSWGLKLQKEEKVTTTIINEIPIPDKENTSSADSSSRVTVSFTVFKSARISQDTKVVTGYNYDPEQINFPKDQYCYVAISANPSKGDTYYVARKSGLNAVNWDSNVPPDLFDLGQKHCLFKSK